MSFILRKALSKELKKLKQELEKISELVQPEEDGDKVQLIQGYKAYINKGRI